MSEEYEVHGQHDHAVEHAAHENELGRWVAMFTALLATLGAFISYQNGNAESRGLELKNEAILKKSEASDKWGYYQAKSIKETIVRYAVPANDEIRAAQGEEVKRYAQEKKELEQEAAALDKESTELNQQSELVIAPHHRLAQALALVQVAIAMAALTVLTRQRWLLGAAGGAAALGMVLWALAFHW